MDRAAEVTLAEVLDGAQFILQQTAQRHRAAQADATDLAAARGAMNAMLAVADHLESSAGAGLSGQDASTISGLRRTFRRYELHLWQMAPKFLRNP